MLDESYKGKLDKNSSTSLVNYLKLVTEIKREEEKENEEISEEELERIANQ